jgi:hypothetical protein
MASIQELNLVKVVFRLSDTVRHGADDDGRSSVCGTSSLLPVNADLTRPGANTIQMDVRVSAWPKPQNIFFIRGLQSFTLETLKNRFRQFLLVQTGAFYALRYLLYYIGRVDE